MLRVFLAIYTVLFIVSACAADMGTTPVELVDADDRQGCGSRGQHPLRRRQADSVRLEAENTQCTSGRRRNLRMLCDGYSERDAL